jgi:hypothetical protein
MEEQQQQQQQQQQCGDEMTATAIGDSVGKLDGCSRSEAGLSLAWLAGRTWAG